MYDYVFDAVMEAIAPYFILILVIDALFALIPANMAEKKGYSFGLWWLYGWGFFLIALIHVSVIDDKNAPQVTAPQPAYLPPSNAGISAADELRKYKNLLDNGAITEKEFEAKKKQILGL